MPKKLTTLIVLAVGIGSVIFLQLRCSNKQATEQSGQGPRFGETKDMKVFQKELLKPFRALGKIPGAEVNFADTVETIGGTWVVLRFSLEPYRSREQAIRTVCESLGQAGWVKEPIDALHDEFVNELRSIVGLLAGENSPNDLTFAHPGDASSPVFYYLRCFISQEGNVLAAYCEVGW